MCIIDLLKISPSEASKVPHDDLCSIGFANIFQQPKLFTFANNRFSSVQFSSVAQLCPTLCGQQVTSLQGRYKASV